MDDSKTILLEVSDLQTHFEIGGSIGLPLGKRKFVHAVNGVSISVTMGETVAVVGESGSGKTTLARTILGLTKLTSGNVRLMGHDVSSQRRISKELFTNIQIVFQDPESALDPTMKVKDIVAEPLWGLMKLPRNEIQEKVRETLEAVGLGHESLERLPRQLSGGQKQRVNIARAIVTEPKLVILDEPTSALDASVQAQILNLLLELQHKFKLSYLLITHNIAVAEYLSDRIYVMYAGKIVETGPTNEVISHPRHPYTITLISSAPIPDPSKRNILNIEIVGEVPSAINPPSGCRFHPRCQFKEKLCEKEEPKLQLLAATRFAACHFVYKTANDRTA